MWKCFLLILIHTYKHTHNGSCIYILSTFYITVPPPTVSVTALNNQIVGQSLTLQCEVTTVRGITSRVDIVWSSGGMELQRMDNVSSTTMNNLLVYTDSYNISQLNTSDEDRVVHCEVIINASPLIMVNNSITLDVTGKCLLLHISCSLSIFSIMIIDKINAFLNHTSQCYVCI